MLSKVPEMHFKKKKRERCVGGDEGDLVLETPFDY